MLVGASASPELNPTSNNWAWAKWVAFEFEMADAEDTIRIMLATDTHIGYAERDPVRGQDSINSFKEVLQLAVKHEVRVNASPLHTHFGTHLLGRLYSSSRRPLS